uniref:histidine kinase n=1 Tax=candidate division WOR-3 bacterium TaxID=2052148 RepID=A0A7C6AF90_UNCW3
MSINYNIDSVLNILIIGKMRRRFFPLQTKLISSFSTVIIIGIFLSTFTGIQIIGNTIVAQGQEKVKLDLNTAREVLEEEGRTIKNIIRLTASRYFVKDALIKRNRKFLLKELQKVKKDEGLDILNITDNTGLIILRTENPGYYDDRPANEILKKVLKTGESVYAVMIISPEELRKESKELAERAKIRILPTPKAKPRNDTIETSGLIIIAGAPVFDDNNNLIGVVYGGRLLNRNFEIVDKIKDIVYKDEKFRNKEIGTATIFLKDLRITTNVRDIAGERAIGTRVSEEVYNQVLVNGKPWVGRAFVVNDWFITAYEPIRDINNQIVGIIYVGMLEAPYVYLKNRVVSIFIFIAILSIIALAIISFITVKRITRPINELYQLTERVSKGDLSARAKIISDDEIGELIKSFNQMVESLQIATEGYVNLTKTLEQKVQEKTNELEKAMEQLVQSEKLSALGRLAAGIAHEINNPLTAILINSHLIKEKAKGDTKLSEKLDMIIDETQRCAKIVSGLLEFSRQTPPEMKLISINEIINKTLILFETVFLANNVKVEISLDKNLPQIMADESKIKQVLTNILLNAIDAMPNGGTLKIHSQLSPDNKFVEIEIEDSGVGIPKENLDRIFDPFFTTKKSKGTGLGLSISYGIIQQHNGSIEVNSEVNKGTKVKIKLPKLEL